MEKEIRLYNIIFPIRWFFIYPFLRIVALPANFIIDSLALILIAYFGKIKNIKNLYKKSILKIWEFWFLADIIWAGFLFLGQSWDDLFGLSYKITNAISYNPRENTFALIWTSIGVLIAGICIYYFNACWSFSKTDLTKDEKKYLALRIAIFTAPYLFLVPLDRLF